MSLFGLGCHIVRYSIYQDVIFKNIYRYDAVNRYCTINMAKKYLLTVTDEMGTKLEKEMKRRMIETVPETVRAILSEYLTDKK